LQQGLAPLGDPDAAAGVMAKTHFSSKDPELFGLTVSQQLQNAFVKKAHYSHKQAKSDLQPFLTIYSIRLRKLFAYFTAQPIN
jgi:hypothetical protein